MLDPRVAPFRDVFDSYELLAYLPIRAAQLGYGCPGGAGHAGLRRRRPRSDEDPVTSRGARSGPHPGAGGVGPLRALRGVRRLASGDFTRCVVVNGLNTGLYWGLQLALLVVLPYMAASLVSMTIAVVVAYWLNARFAFRVGMNGRALAGFVAGQALTIALRTSWWGCSSRCPGWPSRSRHRSPSRWHCRSRSSSPRWLWCDRRGPGPPLPVGSHPAWPSVLHEAR